MINELRLNEILEYLQRKKQATNEELCSYLHCSISTLRRDLIKLEQQGLIGRMHGGAMLISSINHEFSFGFREGNETKEKQIIASLARDFIAPGMCIFLDSSSTVMTIVPQLKEISDLIVITNGLQLAVELANNANPTHKMYVLGGELKNNSNAIFSNNQESIFKSIRFDLALFSSLGIDETGIYETRLSQVTVKQQIMQNSKSSILLIDHTKFNQSHFCKLAEYADFDALVTDERPPENLLYSHPKTEWIYPRN